MSRPRLASQDRHRLPASGLGTSRSFRDIGMTSGNAIPPGMEDEGFTFVIVVLFNFTNKNDVVAAVVLANLAADKLGDHPMKKRHSSGSFVKFDSSELVGHGSGELPRKVVLSRLQNVHREVSRVDEIRKANR